MTSSPGPQTPAPRAADVLRELEWSAGPIGGWCPICCDGKGHGHTPDCRLARALAAEAGREKLRRDAHRETRNELAMAASALETVANPVELPAEDADALANLRSYAALHARAARRALADDEKTEASR